MVAAAVVATLSLWPAPARAQSTADLSFRILPKECFLEIINDGSQQLNYVHPDDCQQMLDKEAVPAEGIQQSNSFPLASPITTQNNQQPSRASRNQPQAASSEDAPGPSVLDAVTEWVGVGSVEVPAVRTFSVVTIVVVAMLIAIDGMVFELRWSKRCYSTGKRGVKAATRPIRRRI
jgi:hypothetical protein